MKKVALLLTLFFVVINVSKAQLMGWYEAEPLLVKSDPASATHGISKELQYEAIINTTLTPSQLMKEIKTFLFQSGILDSSQLKVYKFNDKTTQFTLPFGYRQGVFCGKGKTIITKRIKAPVQLNFDAIFRFQGGSVSIKFTNFREDAVCFIDGAFFGYKYYKKEGYVTKGSIWYDAAGESIPESDPGVAILRKVYEFNDKAYKEGTLTGKIGTVLESLEGTHTLGDGSIRESLQKNFSSLRRDLDNEYSVYKSAVLNKLAVRTDSEGMLLLLSNSNKKVQELAKQRFEGKFLLLVDNERWDKYFEKIFNSVFLGINEGAKGTIVGVRRDGEPAYEFKEGKLVSVSKRSKK